MPCVKQALNLQFYSREEDEETLLLLYQIQVSE